MVTHRRTLSSDEQTRIGEITAELQSMVGVEEVVIALDEGAAYLKVDKQRFTGELYGSPAS